MNLTREQVEWLLFEAHGRRRFTQDTPVLPDCWVALAIAGGPVQFLLTPYRDEQPSRLAGYLRNNLGVEEAISNQSVVLAELNLTQLLSILPLSDWWRREVGLAGWRELAVEFNRPGWPSSLENKQGLRYLVVVAWTLYTASHQEVLSVEELLTRAERSIGSDPFSLFLSELSIVSLAPGEKPLLWSVHRNREATTSIDQSTLAVKADASRQLFNINCSNLRWGIIDSGVDAHHYAFRKRQPGGKLLPKPFESQGPRRLNHTRVARTYNFNLVRKALSPTVEEDPEALPILGNDCPTAAKRLRVALLTGGDVDWGALQPILEVVHDDTYPTPVNIHGTHVGGILAADYRPEDRKDYPEETAQLPEEGLVGVCPDLELYDLRVLDQDGRGDEFSVISALQFIRYLNSKGDRRVVHGVNLSLSILQDVVNYASGKTPICEECERLVASGVVVVTAAGNQGYQKFSTPKGPVDNYMGISITDPGNTDSVITVGATHRNRPHTYGVSYFSSRGPTGDGRQKPDLVAPGEKIRGPAPGQKAEILDGTSMAAPHVSGACALLMARHLELVGQPARIKQILCSTATDLGRDRYFQGAGMLDTLRALQSV